MLLISRSHILSILDIINQNISLLSSFLINEHCEVRALTDNSFLVNILESWFSENKLVVNFSFFIFHWLCLYAALVLGRLYLLHSASAGFCLFYHLKVYLLLLLWYILSIIHFQIVISCYCLSKLFLTSVIEHFTLIHNNLGDFL